MGELIELHFAIKAIGDIIGIGLLLILANVLAILHFID